MRFNVYDFTKVLKGMSVAPASQTAGATNGSKVDTLGADNAAIYGYGGLTSSNPSVATLAVKVQESADGSTAWSDALDNTGTVIGFTLNCQAALAENIARIEGLGLNRKRYLRAVTTAAFTGGTSPAIVGFAQIILGNLSPLAVDTAVSNT
jgi:hypothetical protein